MPFYPGSHHASRLNAFYINISLAKNAKIAKKAANSDTFRSSWRTLRLCKNDFFTSPLDVMKNIISATKHTKYTKENEPI